MKIKMEQEWIVKPDIQQQVISDKEHSVAKQGCYCFFLSMFEETDHAHFYKRPR